MATATPTSVPTDKHNQTPDTGDKVRVAPTLHLELSGKEPEQVVPELIEHAARASRNSCCRLSRNLREVDHAPNLTGNPCLR